jgi:hypothetical protein
MKQLIKYLLGLSVALNFAACTTDYLETNPTSSTSGTTIFKDDKSALVALNGIYRLMYTSGWSLSNTHQNFGNTSTSLFADLMGEDMVQHEQGSGWFWYDYIYDVRRRYTSTGWRSYATWNYYYSLISNANYIIAQETTIGGDPANVKYIVASAYAIRAYSYFYLIQIFQQTYVGHQTLPGVPLYTEPTTSASVGKPRGTVEQVYTQINADLDKSIALFKASGVSQMDKSHIDYYVANGFKAKVALVQGKWQAASDAAKEALTKTNLTLMTASQLSTGFNDVTSNGVMWGATIIADQATIYASFFSHMDPTAGMYGSSSRKCISSWLYGQIPTTDARKSWWGGYIAPASESSSGVNASYVQKKFLFKNVTTYTGDYIFLRAEELLLVEAEAQCRLGNYTPARSLLTQLGANRDPNYSTRLATMTNANTQTLDTKGTGSTPVITTLLDEVLLQRRIELWGETGRIFDILRLAHGFTRNFTGTNHPTAGLLTKFGGAEATTPDYKEFILTIPQTEFDGNTSLTSADQNPM